MKIENIFLCSCSSQVLIDITEHSFSSDGPRATQRLKKLPRSTIEIIDLNNVSESCLSFTAKSCGKVHQSSYTANLATDVICLDSLDGDGGPSPVPVSRDLESSYTTQHNGVRSCLQDSSSQRSVTVSHPSSPKDISLAFEPSNGLLEFFEAQNTNHTEQTSTSPHAENPPDHDERLDSPHSWLNKALSPFSLDSPYYCPSEIDTAVFSDESLILYDDDKGQKYTTCSLDQTESLFGVGESMELQEKTHAPTLATYPRTQSELNPQTLPTSDRAPVPVSPTSTELLAGDSPETASDLDMESPPISPVKSSYTLSPPSRVALGVEDSPSVLQASGMDVDVDGADLSERQTEDAQQISLVQFKKLKHLFGGRVQDMVNISMAYFLKKKKRKRFMLISWPQSQVDPILCGEGFTFTLPQNVYV